MVSSRPVVRMHGHSGFVTMSDDLAFVVAEQRTVHNAVHAAGLDYNTACTHCAAGTAIGV